MDYLGGCAVGYWETYYHLIWSTKLREPWLSPEIEPVVVNCVRNVADDYGALMRAIGVMDDHVHLAVSIPPRLSIPTFVREAKTRSTKLINSSRLLERQGTFSWQHEYGIFTFGRQSLDDVVSYVLNQREHYAAGTLRPYFEITDSRDVSSFAPKERSGA
jgi:putative transposase